MVNLLRRTFLF